MYLENQNLSTCYDSCSKLHTSVMKKKELILIATKMVQFGIGQYTVKLFPNDFVYIPLTRTG